jgi:hypothetical protein
MTEHVSPILSKQQVEKTNSEKEFGVDVIKAKSVRGLSLSSVRDRDREGKGVQVQRVDLVGQAGDVSTSSTGVSNVKWPAALGPILQPVSSLERVNEEDAVRVTPTDQVAQVGGNLVIDKLDLLVAEASGKKHVTLEKNFTQEDSNLSSSSSSQSNMVKQISLRHRKPLSRLPFPGVVGPKCLRLVEIVNSVGVNSRRKKSGRGDASSNESKGTTQQSEDFRAVEETGIVLEEYRDLIPTPCDTNNAQDVNVPISGINYLIGEDDLEDVEGFVTNRIALVAKRLEAEQILEIQTDLGLNFCEGKEVLLDQLVELEDRDRVKLGRLEETQGLQ